MKRTMIALVAAVVMVAGLAFTPFQVAFADDECGMGVTLMGNAMPNVINGGPNNDRIDGGGGNDQLFGWGCNDRIRGGAGNDYIDGGPGTDWCDGGPGVDVIVNCELP